VITNTDARSFDVVEVTNEMPVNRIGGVGTVVENLLSGFVDVGVRALWFVLDHGYRPFELERLLAEYPSVAIGTPADLRRFTAPVAHLHSYTFNPTLMRALLGRKVIFTIHSLLVEEERSNDVVLTTGVAWQEALIERCDAVVVISEAEHRRYRELGYARLNPNVTVVYNGVGLPPQRQRRPRDSEQRVLGYSGRLVPRKRPEYVQMILREPGFEGCRTMIAGKAFSPYASNLVRELELEDRVQYLGWCGGARLEAFYDSIDVLALPSVYEPFGLAALEAAARGIPVVCTAVDGLVEVLGEFAFYCQSLTYEGFRTAMRRWAAADDEQIAQRADGARARYLRRFTDVAMAARYSELFAEVTRATA
jgi:glycosyltransferase involved in cell wall biosynthesis